MCPLLYFITIYAPSVFDRLTVPIRVHPCAIVTLPGFLLQGMTGGCLRL